MNRFTKIILLAVILLPLYLSAQTDEVLNKIVETGKTDNRTMYFQDVLCNIIGGRITGSEAYTAAANWALNELKSWELNAELDEVGEMPVGFNRGAWFGKIIEPKEMHLDFATPSYTAGTKGKQKGHVVILPPSEAALDSMKSRIKNAWVLIDGVNEGWPRDRDSISRTTKKLIEYGALGTIQLSTFPIRVLDLRTIKSWDELPKLPDIKLIDYQYNEIKDLVKISDKDVKLEFDIRNHFRKGPIKYHNVIGWIPGTEYPEQYVIIGAHLDSYDIATGAVDNASGVSRMMEAIRLIVKAGAKPKRTIMIQLYAAEERGLVGSLSWVNKNKNKLSQISVMLNNDSGTNPITSMLVPKVIFDALKPVSETVAKIEFKYPFKIQEMPMFRRAGRGGTDSHSFNMAGVPAPWLRTEGPHQYGRTWHTPLDTYNEIIPDAQEHSALVIALLAYQIANMENLLPREDAFLPEGIYADLNTNKGRITVSLDYENLPMTSANFIGLAEGTIKNQTVAEGKPYFNGSIWHRVVPGHVIQAGKPNTENETEGPGYEFPNEIFTGLSHNKAGMLGMANAGPHTNGSQFYITLGDRSYLDGNYTLFGSVAEGMDVVNKIVQGDTIKSVTIVRIGEKANSFKPNTETFFKMVDEAQKKAKDDEEKKHKEEDDTINKKYSGALTKPNGLKYIIEKEGMGEIPGNGALLKVVYSGKFLLSDVTFSSTSDSGKPDQINNPEQFDYIIGKTSINPAIDEMLKEMKPGEKRIVIVPSNLAYGNNGFYGKMIEGQKRFVISPKTSLVYKLEILSMQ